MWKLYGAFDIYFFKLEVDKTSLTCTDTPERVISSPKVPSASSLIASFLEFYCERAACFSASSISKPKSLNIT